MLHHFTAIDVDLEEEREPCLELDMYKDEMFIKEIKIFAFMVNSIKGK